MSDSEKRAAIEIISIQPIVPCRACAHDITQHTQIDMVHRWSSIVDQIENSRTGVLRLMSHLDGRIKAYGSNAHNKGNEDVTAHKLSNIT